MKIQKYLKRFKLMKIQKYFNRFKLIQDNIMLDSEVTNNTEFKDNMEAKCNEIIVLSENSPFPQNEQKNDEIIFYEISIVDLKKTSEDIPFKNIVIPFYTSYDVSNDKITFRDIRGYYFVEYCQSKWIFIDDSIVMEELRIKDLCAQEIQNTSVFFRDSYKVRIYKQLRRWNEMNYGMMQAVEFGDICRIKGLVNENEFINNDETITSNIPNILKIFRCYYRTEDQMHLTASCSSLYPICNLNFYDYMKDSYMINSGSNYKNLNCDNLIYYMFKIQLKTFHCSFLSQGIITMRDAILEIIKILS